MDTALDGSLNRHGGSADMESNADERARERAEAVFNVAYEALSNEVRWGGMVECPECGELMVDERDDKSAHLRDCELLRARAESEVG